MTLVFLPPNFAAVMEPQVLLGISTSAPHRSLAGHALAAGAYVFIFGVLAYLAFLAHGGIPGQLLLIYVSSIPLALAIGTVTAIAHARGRLAAHHVVAGCLNAMLLCGVGGIWLVFGRQLILTLIGASLVAWLVTYSPAAPYLRPSTPAGPASATRTTATVAAAILLLAGGVGLTALAVYGQIQRPGGLNITIGA